MSVPMVVYHSHYIYGEYEPGNATRYTALAMPIDNYCNCGWLGTVLDGWLVASGMTNCKAYLVPKNIHLEVNWIGEHFDLQGEDAKMFTELLKKMLGGR